MASKPIGLRIADALEDLSEKNLKKFVQHLLSRQEEPRIRRNKVEGKDFMDIADVLVSFYTDEVALTVAVETLKQAGLSKQAKELAAGGQSPCPTPSNPPSGASRSKKDFVEKPRQELINQVTNIEPIRDDALDDSDIQQEVHDKIINPPTTQDKVKALYNGLVKAAEEAKTKIKDSVANNEKYLNTDLKKKKNKTAGSTGTLAEGCFRKIYKEKYNDTWAAIKRVPQTLISQEDLERDCEVYNKTNHPNIVKLLGNITLKDEKWVIPLEFVFGEDLETTIFKASKSKIQLTPSNRDTIIVGMCEGLLHLHSRDIVHQDLKPKNIMVEHNTNRAVITGLGLTKYSLNSAKDKGNKAYLPPEVQMRNQWDRRSDVWAMGKIIAELCTRSRLDIANVCPAKIKEKMKDQPYCHAVCRMVEPNPTLRPVIGVVLGDIRRAGGAGVVPKTPPQSNLLQPPSSDVRKTLPMDQGLSPLMGSSLLHMDALQMTSFPPSRNRDLLPMNRTLAINRSPSPVNQYLSPSLTNLELFPDTGTQLLHAQRVEDMNKNHIAALKGVNNLMEDFGRMMPRERPTTVVVQHFQEEWEQNINHDNMFNTRFNTK